MSSLTWASAMPRLIAGLPAGRWPVASTAKFPVMLWLSEFVAARHCASVPLARLLPGRPSRKRQSAWKPL